MASGELIVSKYVAESITMIAGRFGHEGLCQLRTEPRCLEFLQLKQVTELLLDLAPVAVLGL